MSLPTIILGEGGLLGRHLSAELEKDPAWRYIPNGKPYSWSNEFQLRFEIRQSLSALNNELSAHSPWVIYWVAGSGMIGVTTSQMNKEAESLQMTLSEIKRILLDPYPNRPGYFFFASSAGGVYGTPKDWIVTEQSAPNPISAYGVGKLQQENLILEFCKKNPSLRAVIGRISSLYGAGQNFQKKGQGFISNLSRAILYRQPINIFVPLDTLRDYFYLNDCATAMRETMETFVNAYPDVNYLVKIFASEECISLARIIGIFNRFNTLAPGWLSMGNSVSLQHTHRLELRSTILEQIKMRRTPIEHGIYQLHSKQTQEYLAGQLPRPS